MSTDRAGLEERLGHVERDLGDLDDQVGLGELDQQTAEHLRHIYLEETARLQAQLVDLSDDPPSPPSSRRRVLAGALLLVIGATVVTVAAVLSLQDRAPDGNATGGIVSSVRERGPVDLANVSNEEMERVVAANPEVVGMRLALARRYLQAVEFSKALEHYMIVLESEQHPEALANVGWMTYLSGRPDVGVSYVEHALTIEPNYPQAYWYLANIRFDGLGDPAAAILPLEALLSYDNLPAELRAAAEELLAAAMEAS